MSGANVYSQELKHREDQLAIQFLPAVKAMSFRLKERLPSSIDYMDLCAIGTEELVKLARRYDESQNDSFWGYAKTRVYGAMLDYLRSLDMVSRSSRRLIKEIEYDEYNEVKNMITYKYNDKGLLMKTIRDEVKEKDRRTYEFFYDDQNNKVKELIYNYKDKLIAAQYTRFNDQKQEVEIEWEDLDNYRKTIQEYNGDQLVKVENLNREGAVTSRTEFQYDDQKNLINLKRYELATVYSNELQLTQETFYERVS